MSTPTLPLVSVIVPLRNEALWLHGLLSSLHAQTYPTSRLEVFLVDGGSYDGTLALAQEAAQKHSHVFVLSNPAGIAAGALNLGLRQAHGEVVLRLDARTRPAPDYIERCVVRLQEGRWAGVAGPQVAAGTTDKQTTHALAINAILGTGAPAYRRAASAMTSETLYLGAFPTSWLQCVGGWDESFAANEDYELCARLRKAGGTLLVDPAIHSTYLVRETLGGLARQYWRYGAWRTRTWRRHPGEMRWRHLAPAALIAAFAVGCLLLVWTAWPLLLLSVAYAVAVAGFTLVLSIRHGLHRLPRLLAAFPTLHFAWGLGFWTAWLRPPNAS